MANDENQVAQEDLSKELAKIQAIKEEADQLVEAIKNFQKELLQDEGEKKSIKTKINELYLELQEKQANTEKNDLKIKNLHTEIFEGTEENMSIEASIKEIDNDLDKIYADTEEKKKQFDEYYSKIFGKIDAGGNIIIRD